MKKKTIKFKKTLTALSFIMLFSIMHSYAQEATNCTEIELLASQEGFYKSSNSVEVYDDVTYVGGWI